MDFTLPPEYRLLQRSIREFVEAEIAPVVEQIDVEDKTPPEVIRKMAEAGLFGLPFASKYGGGGAGELGYCILMEEMARHSSAIGVIVGAHIGIGAGAFYLDGTEAQREQYMPPVCRGETLACFCLTEPQAGSDAANIRTTATRDGDHWLINGTKLWASNGSRADVMSVFASTDRHMGRAAASPRLSSKKPSAASPWPGWKKNWACTARIPPCCNSTTCRCPTPTSSGRWARASPRR